MDKEFNEFKKSVRGQMSLLKNRKDWSVEYTKSEYYYCARCKNESMCILFEKKLTKTDCDVYFIDLKHHYGVWDIHLHVKTMNLNRLLEMAKGAIKNRIKKEMLEIQNDISLLGKLQ